MARTDPIEEALNEFNRLAAVPVRSDVRVSGRHGSALKYARVYDKGAKRTEITVTLDGQTTTHILGNPEETSVLRGQLDALNKLHAHVVVDDESGGFGNKSVVVAFILAGREARNRPNGVISDDAARAPVTTKPQARPETSAEPTPTVVSSRRGRSGRVGVSGGEHPRRVKKVGVGTKISLIVIHVLSLGIFYLLGRVLDSRKAKQMEARRARQDQVRAQARATTRR